MAGPLKQSEAEAVLAGLFLGLARLPGLLWRWRWETGALLVAYVALTGNPAAFAFGVLAVAWLALPLLEDAFAERGKQPPRALTVGAALARLTRARYHVARIRRRWRRAVRTAGLAPVHIRRVTRSSTGWELGVVYTAGQTAGSVDRASASLASALRARDVRVFGHATDARRGTIIIALGTDPLADLGGTPWPWLTRARTSLWDPIPIGVDAEGRTVTITLPEQTALLGGLPGAGKSNLASMLVAAAAGDPTVRLHLIDGKAGLEFGPWKASAERVVGSDVREAISMLEGLRTVMDARYADLLARGRRKVHRDDGLPLHVLIIDELAVFTKATKKKDADEFSGLLRDLVARGRAAGIILVSATQRPSADIVPTSLRDLISIRIALRSTTPDASDTILGKGMAQAGYNAATIPAGQHGTGLLLNEGTHPRRFRAYLVTDEDVAQLAQRAGELREREGTSTQHKVSDDQSAPVSGPVEAPAAAEPAHDYAATVHQGPTGPQTSREIMHAPRAVPDSPVKAALVALPERNGHSKRALKQVHVEMELAKDHERSDREIGRICGVTGPTVAAARKRLGLRRSA